jgi:hypothetical protein
VRRAGTKMATSVPSTARAKEVARTPVPEADGVQVAANRPFLGYSCAQGLPNSAALPLVDVITTALARSFRRSEVDLQDRPGRYG